MVGWLVKNGADGGLEWRKNGVFSIYRKDFFTAQAACVRMGPRIWSVCISPEEIQQMKALYFYLLVVVLFAPRVGLSDSGVSDFFGVFYFSITAVSSGEARKRSGNFVVPKPRLT